MKSAKEEKVECFLNEIEEVCKKYNFSMHGSSFSIALTDKNHPEDVLRYFFSIGKPSR